jgi:Sap, sulfolipid-1-addressing protein
LGSAIGNILPLSLGVAISPIPIIAVILMLLSPKARTNGPDFLVGWVAGLVVVSIAVTAFAGDAGLGSGGGGSTAGSLIKLLLGLLLIGLGVREFRKRPRPGEQPSLPGWMRAIDSFFGFTAESRKAIPSAFTGVNLSLTVAAAVTIAQQGLSTASAAFVLAVFVVLASLSIVVPVALYVFGGTSAARALDGLRTWLDANNATVMAVLLLVIRDRSPRIPPRQTQHGKTRQQKAETPQDGGRIGPRSRARRIPPRFSISAGQHFSVSASLRQLFSLL